MRDSQIEKTDQIEEWATNSHARRSPTPAQIESSDGSLTAGTFTMRTDEQGYLMSGREHPGASDATVVLRDSIVECMFLPEGQRITDFAEMTTGSAVFNGRVSGATSLHLLTVLIGKVLANPPRRIVWMNGILDINCARCPDQYWSNDRYLSPYVLPKGTHMPRLKLQGPLDFRQRMTILATAATAGAHSGIGMVLATLPFRRRDPYAEAAGESYDSFLGDIIAVNKHTRATAETLRIPLIDLARDLESESAIHYDFYHANIRGAEIIGDALGHGIRSLGGDLP